MKGKKERGKKKGKRHYIVERDYMEECSIKQALENVITKHMKA